MIDSDENKEEIQGNIPSIYQILIENQRKISEFSYRYILGVDIQFNYYLLSRQ